MAEFRKFERTLANGKTLTLQVHEDVFRDNSVEAVEAYMDGLAEKAEAELAYEATHSDPDETVV